jgi:DNA-binding NarL/FixJ family response regulator
MGCLPKTSSPEQIIAAIKDVARGGSPLTGNVARQLVRLFQRTTADSVKVTKLSTRERQVMHALSRGRSYQSIAKELGISYATVHTHIKKIYKKFRVRSSTQAVSFYLHQVAQAKFKMVEPQNLVKLPGKTKRRRPALSDLGKTALRYA